LGEGGRRKNPDEELQIRSGPPEKILAEKIKGSFPLVWKEKNKPGLFRPGNPVNPEGEAAVIPR
jgi:hypothetical protein